MRYAVISDIHGNLEALQAVFADIDSNDIDIIVCLGDIVGYYTDPEACINLIREHASYSVAGNHDYASIGKIDTKNFTFYALQAMEWTKKHLSAESLKYIESLPLTIQLDSMVFTHSSPALPELFPYVFLNSQTTIIQAFSSMVCRMTFIGHTHWPFIMSQREPRVINTIENMEHEIDPDAYYLINVGSVGQPRNHTPFSSYAIFDNQTRMLSLMAVEYDVRQTQSKVHRHNLPVFLADRLAQGR